MNAEQGFPAWRAEQHRRAQSFALGWAERAETEYDKATVYDDTARRNTDSAYLRDTVAEDRRQAQFHGVRSTEALKLAEMWARVARALADGALPEPEPALRVDLERPAAHGSLTDSLADPSIVGRSR
ncbi:hypothetical protein [Streptomyces sp. NPDC002547]